MPAYPARLIPEPEGRVMLILPDVPELVVVADSEEQAFERAPALLDAILAGYVGEARTIPAPSDICGAPMVATAKFTLLGIE